MNGSVYYTCDYNSHVEQCHTLVSRRQTLDLYRGSRLVTPAVQLIKFDGSRMALPHSLHLAQATRILVADCVIERAVPSKKP